MNGEIVRIDGAKAFKDCETQVTDEDILLRIPKNYDHRYKWFMYDTDSHVPLASKNLVDWYIVLAVKKGKKQYVPNGSLLEEIT